MKSFNFKGKNIRGLLIDLDGVLYIGSSPIEGAVRYIKRIIERDIPIRYITNTTRMSRRSLMYNLHEMGFPVEPEWVFSAPMAARQYVLRKNPKSIFLLTGGDVRSDFEDLPISETSADILVMGDPGNEVDYNMLNRGFRILMDGADFVAMQRNRYWRTEDGLVMDAGAFVAALEYASGKSATVVGKPSEEFFNLAVESLGLPGDEIAMIGDDIETDIKGANSAGILSILVKTGKYRAEEVNESEVKPDLVIDSFPSLEKYEI
jgi:HAD superfamily hydrolase (TIGR01458 family)